ncbi:hypothetical protein PFMALIP_00173 [Plasmodium falciparum MaliPS096_E11]|nr:hypothetical protein PFMALIP_00173 [Plasmodium falciparum MaliPS096_E11]
MNSLKEEYENKINQINSNNEIKIKDVVNEYIEEVDKLKVTLDEKKKQFDKEINYAHIKAHEKEQILLTEMEELKCQRDNKYSDLYEKYIKLIKSICMIINIECCDDIENEDIIRRIEEYINNNKGLKKEVEEKEHKRHSSFNILKSKEKFFKNSIEDKSHELKKKHEKDLLSKDKEIEEKNKKIKELNNDIKKLQDEILVYKKQSNAQQVDHKKKSWILLKDKSKEKIKDKENQINVEKNEEKDLKKKDDEIRILNEELVKYKTILYNLKKDPLLQNQDLLSKIDINSLTINEGMCVDKIEEHILDYDEEINKSRSNLFQLKNEICSLTTEVMELNNKKNELIEENNKLNLVDQGKKKLKKDVEKQKKEIEKLNKQLTKCNKQIDELNEEVEKLNNENIELITYSNDLNNKFDMKENNLMMKLDENEDNIKKMKSKIDDMEKEIKYREDEKKRNLNEINNLKKKNEDMCIKYNEMNIKYGDICVKYEEMSLTYKETSLKYEQIKVKYDEKCFQYDEKCSQYDEIRFQYDEKCFQYDEINKKYGALLNINITNKMVDSKVDRNNNEIISVDNKVEGIANYLKQIFELNEEIIRLKGEINKISLLYSNELNEKNSYDINMKHIQEQLLFLEKTNKENEEKIINLTSQYSDAYKKKSDESKLCGAQFVDDVNIYGNISNNNIRTNEYKYEEMFDTNIEEKNGMHLSKYIHLLEENKFRCMKIIYENENIKSSNKIIGLYNYSRYYGLREDLCKEEIVPSKIGNISNKNENNNKKNNTCDGYDEKVTIVLCIILNEIIKFLFLNDEYVLLFEKIHKNVWKRMYIPEEIKFFILKYITLLNNLRDYIISVHNNMKNEKYDECWFLFQHYFERSSDVRKEMVHFLLERKSQENLISFKSKLKSKKEKILTMDILNFSKEHMQLKTIAHLRKEINYEKLSKDTLNRDYNLLLYKYQECVSKLKRVKNLMKEINQNVFIEKYDDISKELDNFSDGYNEQNEQHVMDPILLNNNKNKNNKLITEHNNPIINRLTNFTQNRDSKYKNKIMDDVKQRKINSTMNNTNKNGINIIYNHYENLNKPNYNDNINRLNSYHQNIHIANSIHPNRNQNKSFLTNQANSTYSVMKNYINSDKPNLNGKKSVRNIFNEIVDENVNKTFVHKSVFF